MTKLAILEYPDPRLRTRAAPIAQVDDAVRKLAADLFETMYAANGVGLAATQVNVHKRLIVIDVSEGRDQPLTLINPELLMSEGKGPGEEGCLSVPGIYDKVKRAIKVRVAALNLKGERFELEADGLLGVCIQHEMDHLEGVLFIDHLSRLRRDRALAKVKKARRAA